MMIFLLFILLSVDKDIGAAEEEVEALENILYCSLAEYCMMLYNNLLNY